MALELFGGLVRQTQISRHLRAYPDHLEERDSRSQQPHARARLSASSWLSRPPPPPMPCKRLPVFTTAWQTMSFGRLSGWCPTNCPSVVSGICPRLRHAPIGHGLANPKPATSLIGIYQRLHSSSRNLTQLHDITPHHIVNGSSIETSAVNNNGVPTAVTQWALP
jgi:hypothetical protein